MDCIMRYEFSLCVFKVTDGCAQVSAVWCLQIDLKVQLIYAVSAVLSQIIEPTINPETRFWFGRLGYTLLDF